MRRSAGYTLIEMIFVVSLCMFLLVLTAILFTTSTRVIKSQHTTKPVLQQLDSMVASLREDVWLADQVAVNQDNELLLKQNESTITWRSDANDQQISRTAGAAQRFYPTRNKFRTSLGKNQFFL